MTDAEWVAANQRLLGAEFARIRARISGSPDTDALEALANARQEMHRPAAIDVLTEDFCLTAFERDVLLLCAGVTMNADLAADCAAHSDASQAFATFGLALARLEGAHWSAVTPIRPLRYLRLIHLQDERALATSRLSIEERVLHYLAGVNYLEPRLQQLLREPTVAVPLAPSHRRAVASAVAALDSGPTRSTVQLFGDDAAGQTEVARRIAEHYGLRLRILNAGDIPANSEDAGELAGLWNRESTLLSSALLVRAEENELQLPVVQRFVERLSALTFVVAPGAPQLGHEIRLAVQRVGAVEQKQLWNEALGQTASLLNGSIDAVATQFRLDTYDIARAARRLKEAQPEARDLGAALWQACRESARTRLDDLATRVEPTASWADLVLPTQQLATLRQVVAHARQRLKVHHHWGFAGKSARGLGLSILFSGESGTGKTMAAEVLAKELHLDLYRIDLSSMVSKYIGETEKNLRRVFDCAESSGAILLFDEADALFGKRSEVKDSHDRYANVEVSYLLQRMESYRGLAILTTNLKGSLDIAFQRRLQFVVQFPFPDAQLRERIWRGVFPEATPLEAIETAKLAQLNVAGGSIRNIAVNAAFLAADAGTPVGMHHLLQAARSEAAKRDRPFSDAEVRGWA